MANEKEYLFYKMIKKVGVAKAASLFGITSAGVYRMIHSKTIPSSEFSLDPGKRTSYMSTIASFLGLKVDVFLKDIHKRFPRGE